MDAESILNQVQHGAQHDKTVSLQTSFVFIWALRTTVNLIKDLSISVNLHIKAALQACMFNTDFQDLTLYTSKIPVSSAQNLNNPFALSLSKG
jgi:hypothetical protein